MGGKHETSGKTSGEQPNPENPKVRRTTSGWSTMPEGDGKFRSNGIRRPISSVKVGRR